MEGGAGGLAGVHRAREGGREGSGPLARKEGRTGEAAAPRTGSKQASKRRQKTVAGVATGIASFRHHACPPPLQQDEESAREGREGNSMRETVPLLLLLGGLAAAALLLLLLLSVPSTHWWRTQAGSSLPH